MNQKNRIQKIQGEMGLEWMVDKRAEAREIMDNRPILIPARDYENQYIVSQYRAYKSKGRKSKLTRIFDI